MESMDNLPITKPNRPSKRRGDKLNNWSHSSTPYGERGRTELEDRQNSRGKRAGTPKKRFLYRIDYIWKNSCFRIEWHRGGKYVNLKDAMEAWESVEMGRGYMGKLGDKFRMVEIGTGKIVREMVRLIKTDS
jgi:hypothetical protein